MSRAASLPLSQAEERERYLAAHARYAGYRDIAREETESVLREVVLDEMRPLRSLRLTEVDGVALGFWDTRWRAFPSPHPEGNFPWARIVGQLRTTPRRFDLAIWGTDVLCGLCVGMAANNKRHVAIRFSESFHGPNPLKGLVAMIAVEYAETYAHILNAGWLKIRDPAPGALPKYAALGFRLVQARGTSYCEREV